MNDATRNDILQKLHVRHQELLLELEALENRIELALVAIHPPSATLQSTALESKVRNANEAA